MAISSVYFIFRSPAYFSAHVFEMTLSFWHILILALNKHKKLALQRWATTVTEDIETNMAVFGDKRSQFHIKADKIL